MFARRRCRVHLKFRRVFFCRLLLLLLLIEYFIPSVQRFSLGRPVVCKKETKPRERHTRHLDGFEIVFRASPSLFPSVRCLADVCLCVMYVASNKAQKSHKGLSINNFSRSHSSVFKKPSGDEGREGGRHYITGRRRHHNSCANVHDPIEQYSNAFVCSF